MYLRYIKKHQSPSCNSTQRSCKSLSKPSKYSYFPLYQASSLASLQPSKATPPIMDQLEESTSPCDRCRRAFSTTRIGSNDFCPACASTQTTPLPRFPASSRAPLYTHDHDKARNLVSLMVRRIAKGDGASKPPWTWYEQAFYRMKYIMPQFLAQTEFPPMEKCVRVVLSDIPVGAQSYTYDQLGRNELWLSSVSVHFAPLPSEIYQDQLVAGAAGVIFEPRFTPEHTYPFSFTITGHKVKDFYLHPELISPEKEPTVTIWRKQGPIKRARQGSKETNGPCKGYITLNSNGMNPPVRQGRAYSVQCSRVDVTVLDVVDRQHMCLRMDKGGVQTEDRALYLDYCKGLFSGKKDFKATLLSEPVLTQPVVRPGNVNFTEKALLDFVKELNLAQAAPELPSADPSNLSQAFAQAYLHTLALRLHSLLKGIPTNQSPICHLNSPKTYFRPTSFLIRLQPDSILRRSTLYLVEIRRNNSETQVLCGVTMSKKPSKPVMALSARQIVPPNSLDWLSFCFWEVTGLACYVREFGRIPQAVLHVREALCGEMRGWPLERVMEHCRDCVKELGSRSVLRE